MSFQTVIDNATYITVDKRKQTAMSISRSGRVKTAERNPSIYRLTVGAPQGLKYSTNRSVLEDIDTNDRVVEANLDIGTTNTNLSYLTSYQGDMDGGSLSMVGSNGANLYIDASSATATTGNVLFKKGDFVQPQGNTGTYRYPYQVTSDVNGIGVGQSNVVVPVHRPVLSQDGVAITSGGVRKGSEVRFHMKAFVCPTYSIVPYDLVEFSGDFEFVEVIT